MSRLVRITIEPDERRPGGAVVRTLCASGNSGMTWHGTPDNATQLVGNLLRAMFAPPLADLVRRGGAQARLVNMRPDMPAVAVSFEYGEADEGRGRCVVVARIEAGTTTIDRLNLPDLRQP